MESQLVNIVQGDLQLQTEVIRNNVVIVSSCQERGGDMITKRSPTSTCQLSISQIQQETKTDYETEPEQKSTQVTRDVWGECSKAQQSCVDNIEFKTESNNVLCSDSSNEEKELDNMDIFASVLSHEHVMEDCDEFNVLDHLDETNELVNGMKDPNDLINMSMEHDSAMEGQDPYVSGETSTAALHLGEDEEPSLASNVANMLLSSVWDQEMSTSVNGDVQESDSSTELSGVLARTRSDELRADMSCEEAQVSSATQHLFSELGKKAPGCICPDSDDELDDDYSSLLPSDAAFEGLDQPSTSRKRKLETSADEIIRKVAKVISSVTSATFNVCDVPIAELIDNPAGIQTWLKYFTSWSGSDRLKAIELLINKCSADQVKHMMETIEPLFQRDFISQLPKEVALHILKYLSPSDLLRSAQTSKYWSCLSDDNLLWKEQCLRAGIISVSKRIKTMPVKYASPWKAEYIRNKYIEHKWLCRPMSSATALKAHDDHVITCLQFYGNIILSGSDDTTLKLWSAITGKCLRTLVGHTGGVWSSQMHKKTVISGSTDRTLRVWDADTGNCLKILTGHTSTVRCMHLHEDRVVSGSRDATLRVWSVSEGKCLKILVGHMAAVRCVAFNGKLVVSGAYDYFVKVWDPNTGECLRTLAGHTNRVYSLQFDGVHIVSGSLDTSIIVWDAVTGHIKHTLRGHQSLTSGMELRDNILVSGNADSTVKVWDITTGQCLHTLSGPHRHLSAVTCLQLNNKFVITSSDDGTVKLWDVKTGQFLRNLIILDSGGSGGVVWRIRASETKLVCAVGSRNGTEETKLMVMNFDVPNPCQAHLI